MDLERMREFGWKYRTENIAVEYKQSIYLADQDIINIFFAKYPGNIP